MCKTFIIFTYNKSETKRYKTKLTKTKKKMETKGILLHDENFWNLSKIINSQFILEASFRFNHYNKKQIKKKALQYAKENNLILTN